MKSEVIAGDFRKGTPIVLSLIGGISLVTGLFVRYYLKNRVLRVETVTEENRRSILSSAAWGVLGGLVFPGFGAVAGVMIGGKIKNIYFVCYLNDGKQFLGVTSLDTYTEIYGYSLRRNNIQKSIEPIKEISGTKEEVEIRKISCKSCGVNNPINFQFCTNCGNKIEYIFCKHCGFKNLESGNYCAGCGMKMKSDRE
ncbi:MAG: zinc ribbon domain-containing protein [Actinobacteria bacterium]|nr:zinc ribbon domain-containing protein [Actinomycetota bacterium]